jgi:hypothetical protein
VIVQKPEEIIIKETFLHPKNEALQNISIFYQFQYLILSLDEKITQTLREFAPKKALRRTLLARPGFRNKIPSLI